MNRPASSFSDKGIVVLLSWWKHRKRSMLKKQPVPRSWNDWLGRLWFIDRITLPQQHTLVDSIKVLVAEKNWEGCGGLVMTDEIRVTIAAQIAWLVLGIGEEYFDRVQSILVYPNAYIATGQKITTGGIVMEGPSTRQGEAWHRGPVILSWDDVKAGGYSPNQGHNVVLHEFAHQLDMLNGRDADGVPSIESKQDAERWIQVSTREFERLVEHCRSGRLTLLDCYGATNPAEFFAVATEAFFQLPEQLRRQQGQLYDVLNRFYLRDFSNGEDYSKDD